MTVRFLAHTADIRVAVEAPSLEALLVEAVDLVRVLVAGDRVVEPVTAHALDLEGAGPADLFYELLRELLYRFSTDAFVPAAVEVWECGDTCFDAVIRGETFDPARHEPQPEVKAVTRHGLQVRHDGATWRAEAVFDL